MILISLIVLLAAGFLAGASVWRLQNEPSRRSSRVRALIHLLAVLPAFAISVLGGLLVWVLVLIGAMAGWHWAKRKPG